MYICMSRRLPLDNPWSVLRLLCPDLGVCVVALVTVILCNRLVRNREMMAAANITSVSLCVGACLVELVVNGQIFWQTFYK